MCTLVVSWVQKDHWKEEVEMLEEELAWVLEIFFFEYVWVKIAMSKGADFGTVSCTAMVSMMYNKLHLDADKRFWKQVCQPSCPGVIVVLDTI